MEIQVPDQTDSGYCDHRLYDMLAYGHHHVIDRCHLFLSLEPKRISFMAQKDHFMDITEKAYLAKQIYDTCHLTGDFLLRSGRRTHEYFDKYQLSSDASLLYKITQQMAALIPADIEVLAGLEMGAIPVVTLLAHHSGLPAAFVRKQPKKYGTARLAEGCSVKDKRVLVVEDVVTSGGQVVLSTADLRALGAKINQALVVIDRQEGGAEKLLESEVTLISLFNREDFKPFGS